MEPGMIYAVAVFAPLFGALVAGLFLKYPWLSAAGFVLMLLSAIWVIASYRRMAAVMVPQGRRGRAGRKGRAPRTSANSGLMERLEERWRRRQEGNNR